MSMTIPEKTAEDGFRQINVRLTLDQVALLPKASSLAESVRLAIEKGLAADVDPDAKMSLDGAVSVADLASETARLRHVMMLLSAQIVATHENVLRARAVSDCAFKLLREAAGQTLEEAAPWVHARMDEIMARDIVETDRLHARLCALAQGTDDPDLDDHGVRIEALTHGVGAVAASASVDGTGDDADPPARPAAAE